MPLSAHEQEVLARIEEQLKAVDDGVAAVPNRNGPPPIHRNRFGLALVICSLSLLLFALIPLAVLILVLDIVAPVVLTFTAAIPWSMSFWLDRAFAHIDVRVSETRHG